MKFIQVKSEKDELFGLGWASLHCFNQSLFCAFKSEVEVAKGRLEVMHCSNLRMRLG